MSSPSLWQEAQLAVVGRGSITATSPPDLSNFWLHGARYPHRNFSDTSNLKSYKLGGWWGPVFMFCIKIKVKQTFAVLLWGQLQSFWGSLLGCPPATSPSQLNPVIGGITFGRCLVPEVKAPQEWSLLFLGKGKEDWSSVISLVSLQLHAKARREEKQRITDADIGKAPCEILRQWLGSSSLYIVFLCIEAANWKWASV